MIDLSPVNRPIQIEGFPCILTEGRSEDEGQTVFRRENHCDFEGARAGVPVVELVRRHGVSEQSIYRWKTKYGGMEVSEAKRLRELEEENRRLKRIVADLSLDKQMLEDVLSRKW